MLRGAAGQAHLSQMEKPGRRVGVVSYLRPQVPVLPSATSWPWASDSPHAKGRGGHGTHHVWQPRRPEEQPMPRADLPRPPRLPAFVQGPRGSQSHRREAILLPGTLWGQWNPNQMRPSIPMLRPSTPVNTALPATRSLPGHPCAPSPLQLRVLLQAEPERQRISAWLGFPRPTCSGRMP